MQRGFSLVELSIVLVILGLLTGGILAGQSLIHAAELRRIQTDLGKYSAAAHGFRDKYFGLPGDISNATKFWGQVATGAACNTAPVDGTKTCDGNGDGMIGNGDGIGNEVFRAWQQLVNAGLLEGTYTGVGFADIDRGVNVPDARVSQGAWCFYQHPANTGAAGFFAMPASKAFMVGAYNGSDPCQGNFLIPEDVWILDRKQDDGMPATGKVRGFPHSTCTNSASGGTDAAATYRLSSKAVNCGVLFQDAF